MVVSAHSIYYTYTFYHLFNAIYIMRYISLFHATSSHYGNTYNMLTCFSDQSLTHGNQYQRCMCSTYLYLFVPYKNRIMCYRLSVMTITFHYTDVMMSTTASEIAGVSIVCWTVCSGADKQKSKRRVTGLCERNPLVTGRFSSQGPGTRKIFPFDDVILCWVRNSTELERVIFSMVQWWHVYLV